MLKVFKAISIVCWCCSHGNVIVDNAEGWWMLAMGLPWGILALLPKHAPENVHHTFQSMWYTSITSFLCHMTWKVWSLWNTSTYINYQNATAQCSQCESISSEGMRQVLQSGRNHVSQDFWHCQISRNMRGIFDKTI